jgi:hypothetical protein
LSRKQFDWNGSRRSADESLPEQHSCSALNIAGGEAVYPEQLGRFIDGKKKVSPKQLGCLLVGVLS